MLRQYTPPALSMEARHAGKPAVLAQRKERGRDSMRLGSWRDVDVCRPTGDCMHTFAGRPANTDRRHVQAVCPALHAHCALNPLGVPHSLGHPILPLIHTPLSQLGQVIGIRGSRRVLGLQPGLPKLGEGLGTGSILSASTRGKEEGREEKSVRGRGRAGR